MSESCRYAKKSAELWLNKVDFNDKEWWKTEPYQIANAYEDMYICIRNELRKQKGRCFVIQRKLKQTKEV